MSRLTKYEPSKDSMFPYKLKSNEILELDVIHKLGILEEIEEEIGCPLDVVFKALKEGKIYFEDGTYSTDFVLQKTPAWAFAIYDNLINNKEIVIIKDYGKTWWLKGDKDA